MQVKRKSKPYLVRGEVREKDEESGLESRRMNAVCLKDQT